MAKTPLISIIIPVYNSRYLKPCIQSCLDQTLGSDKLEIIVVNDASTDDSAARLDEMSQTQPLRILHQPANAGPAAARNAGLEIARGEYVAFLDSDDMMKPDKLVKQLDYCSHNPGIEAVISGIEEIDEQAKFMRELIRDFPISPEAQIETIFLDNLHTITSTLLFKRSLLSSTKFMDPGLQNLEDMEFALKLLRHTNMAYYPESLTIRRVLSSGLSHSVSETIFMNSRRDYYSSAIKMFPELSDLEKGYWSLNYARLGRILQRQELGQRARYFYLQSLKNRISMIALLGIGLSFFPAGMQKSLAAKNWRTG